MPVGTRLTSSAGLHPGAWCSGAAPTGKGEWTEERVNVLEDYQKYFEETETPEACRHRRAHRLRRHRESTAQGDYANFRVCKP